ncbi:DUF1697 domain-containing protein [Bacillus sp. HMF5848]|nr:DUF1697 domain-containing protein [Bacillus sp. HMF5848]
MTVYIALLRGINVGGKNKIKMADLRLMCESIGLSQIETYIQSGNVLFESNEEEHTLQRKLEHEIEKKFGFSVSVILRTADEWKRIMLDCPFTVNEVTEAETANTEGESLYVAMLSEAPQQEKLDELNSYKSKVDDYRINDRDLYLLFQHSIRNSKLANNLQKLDVPITIRNWKTINKLYAMVKARKAVT